VKAIIELFKGDKPSAAVATDDSLAPPSPPPLDWGGDCEMLISHKRQKVTGHMVDMLFLADNAFILYSFWGRGPVSL